MRNKKHTSWWIIGIVVVILLGVGLSVGANGGFARKDEVTVGTIGPDVQIWQHIADSEQAKKAGLKIKVKSFTDPVALNRATASGEIDVNAFQSWSYLQAYNKENKKAQLAALGTTYLEPMGLYSDRYHSIKEIPDGATVAIANNPANTARGLLLLQSAGLIKLKSNFGATSGTNDIASNPKNLQFKEIDDTTGPRVLKSTDLVLIGNTIALTGHLNVLKDSIYHEKVDQSTKDNINVLATAKKNRHNKEYKKLVTLYHNKQIQQWISKKYQGTKVNVKKPLSYLK
ncbi:metal ABC transporter substrate-binding protein [Limosilactobacillus sp. RRLNB_1_1]|uniref:Lipoprotein n=1 Tax=Limosilactobacillus albertensis TaxID=2759752 RepID=A0A7W3TR67_9LACO|nr:MetQ/NlpA family ABC transporter substrate-binding protein [Limosilactobacillus albertensis]MBB1069395.1 metal ABC transporter substrate-binding protein [Limosilactobacillus albertensis]MCD7118573.1 MetQ/NlpA family ABC transporter substrate-binding protein [Limosilactobacillus albertensis]MCD7128382.1 MetQ/NlpA family ABC transporter substrate-binding protein [Limosilactobacillus albertensis]